MPCFYFLEKTFDSWGRFYHEEKHISLISDDWKKRKRKQEWRHVYFSVYGWEIKPWNQNNNSQNHNPTNHLTNVHQSTNNLNYDEDEVWSVKINDERGSKQSSDLRSGSFHQFVFCVYRNQDFHTTWRRLKFDLIEFLYLLAEQKQEASEEMLPRLKRKYFISFR